MAKIMRPYQRAELRAVISAELGVEARAMKVSIR